MVLNNCTVCCVYDSEEADQKRIRVKYTGNQIFLYLNRENDLPDSEQVRIDFFDERIGCIKAKCELTVRRNYDNSVREPFIADCEILDVIEIIQGRRHLRVKVEEEVKFTSFKIGGFSGDIQNISEGGLYFITRTRLRSDDTIEFRYILVEKEYLLRAVILREEDFRDGRYGYGCQFMELPQGAARDIMQYMFMRQHGRL